MTKKVSRLQQIVGLLLLIVGLGLYVHHVIKHPGESGGFDVKAALAIAGVGLLLLPFDFSNVREVAVVAGKRASGMFKAVSGGDGSKPGAG